MMVVVATTIVSIIINYGKNHGGWRAFLFLAVLINGF